MRLFDHLVLPVADLALARSRLTSLGFTVAPDARHPFGTGNCCVFFQNGTYLEPLAVVDRNLAEDAIADGLFFVRRAKRYLDDRGEGFAMLALRSADAEADQAKFEAAAIAAGPVFRFTRSATLADGSEQEIGVALAYCELGGAPHATVFACQRINTEMLFDAAFVTHPNGAMGVVEVTAVAAEPTRFRAELEAALDGMARELPNGEGVGVRFGDDGSTLAVVTPGRFRARFGIDGPAPGSGLIFAGFDIQVSELDRTIGYAGPTAIRQGSRIVVPPAPGLGGVLAFREGA